MFKIVALVIFSCRLMCESHTGLIEQAQKWQNVQQQLAILSIEYNRIKKNRDLDNQEFFNIQQQLGAIYLAQKRYRLGFGTALLPSKNAVINYVRKKTFLNLKTDQLLPIYKRYVKDYQKKYGSGEFDRLQKKVKHLEALNLLHMKLFEQQESEHGKKDWINKENLEKVSSMQSFISKSAPQKLKKSKNLLNWITPVAGIRESSVNPVWRVFPGAIVLCPDVGIVSSIVQFEESIAVFIKRDHFTYVITGLNRCCVKVGENVVQGEPIGFSSDKSPTFVELQLWLQDLPLDPEPYHKVLQL